MDADTAEQPTGTEATAKRRARCNPGQHKCWCTGCDCRIRLKRVPKEFAKDADWSLEANMSFDRTAGVKGPPRRLPDRHNMLCEEHYPPLPEKPILGETVLVLEQDKLVKAVVDQPAPTTRRAAAGAAMSAVANLREQKWLARTTEGALHTLATHDVWKAAGLHEANKVRARRSCARVSCDAACRASHTRSARGARAHASTAYRLPPTLHRGPSARCAVHLPCGTGFAEGAGRGRGEEDQGAADNARPRAQQARQGAGAAEEPAARRALAARRARPGRARLRTRCAGGHATASAVGHGA